MATATTQLETFADLLQRLGDVSPERIRMNPLPGTAKPLDVLPLCERSPKRLCELVDGVLVEKAVGHQESRLAAWLLHFLTNFLAENDIGIITCADGPHQLADDVVRLPDVAFIAYDRIPQGADPTTPMPDWVPSLAVEIISRGNTRAEMERKLSDFFEAGVNLIWYVYPDTRTVEVYTSVSESVTLTDEDYLDGGDVLPGFSVSIREWFERALKVNR